MMPLKQIKQFALIAVIGLFMSACASSDMAGVYGTSTAKEGTVRELVRNVGDRVFFATDRSALTGSARVTIQKQADWLRGNDISLMIAGHADERGTRDYNLALGARRANAVRDYLVSLGIDPSRLSTISYGKERPVSLCSEEVCWSKNRRAVSVIR